MRLNELIKSLQFIQTMLQGGQNPNVRCGELSDSAEEITHIGLVTRRVDAESENFNCNEIDVFIGTANS